MRPASWQRHGASQQGLPGPRPGPVRHPKSRLEMVAPWARRLPSIPSSAPRDRGKSHLSMENEVRVKEVLLLKAQEHLCSLEQLPSRRDR